jgi:SAM-dependent methyltransferase
MDQKLELLCREVIESRIFDMVISGSTDRERLAKVKLRTIQKGNGVYYQIEEYRGTQVFHRNIEAEALFGELEPYLGGLFRQAEFHTRQERIHVLFGKKGRVTIRRKADRREEMSEDGVPLSRFSHNRKKQYLLEEGIPVPFLYELGVMNQEGYVIKAKYDKFRQLNRFLEFVDDIYPELAGKEEDRELTILDFGCGKSYLTFALYHYLRILKGRRVRIIGLDLKKDVVAACSRLAEHLGYEGLQFLAGDIAEYEGVSQVDMVVTLHACDTATDYALEKAVKWGASVILSVPCCQHELNRQIKNELLRPVLKYGLIQERFSALLTDALRGTLLEAAGYQVQLLEFIDMEHTPKNILIRAVRQNRAVEAVCQRKRREAERCMEFFQVEPTLARLLAPVEEKQ